MRDFFWKFEHFLILAIKKPNNYIIPLSAIFSGIFVSLEISEPIKNQIDKIPFISESEWLYSVIFALLFYILLNLISLIFSTVIGLQPFELIAKYVDLRRIPMTLTNYIERRISKLPEEVYPLDYRVRLIEKKDLHEYNLLNREIFHFTAFTLTLKDIERRNSELFKVNESAFAFIEINIHGLFLPIGISTILPLNSIGKSLYLQNKGLKDSEITPELIARSGEQSDAIILFSMGILPSFSNKLREKSLTIAYVFTDHLVKILSEMTKSLEHQHNLDEVYLYAQTEKPNGGLGRLLKRIGFIRLDTISGDGFPLWNYRLEISKLEKKRSKELSTITIRDFLDQLLEK